MSTQSGQKHKELVVEHDRDGEEIVIPLGTVTGARPGPVLAVTAGMHAGEYAGILAAIRLFRELDPAQVAGTVLVVPIISARAFMMRSMQLSPVDEKEVHFQVPGRPDGSYSERQIDALFRIVRTASYVIDLHGGEFAQSLTPWVVAPISGSHDVDRRSVALARSFNVPLLDFRTDLSSVPAYARFLAERGIANVWTEIGQNGLVDPACIELHYEGCLNALRAVGMLPGQQGVRARHRYLGQRHHTIVAERSGIWQSNVRAGQIVREGELLGVLHDFFGDVLERYDAPFDGIVLYYWSSPAINAERRPHGYPWHSGLVRLAGLPTDAPNVDL